jgi:hypothetical protein
VFNLPEQVDTKAVLAADCQGEHPAMRPKDEDNERTASCTQSRWHPAKHNLKCKKTF